MFYMKVSDGRRDRFPMRIDKCAEHTSSRSSTSRARQTKRIEVDNSARKIISALKDMYLDKIRDERAIVSSKTASS